MADRQLAGPGVSTKPRSYLQRVLAMIDRGVLPCRATAARAQRELNRMETEIDLSRRDVSQLIERNQERLALLRQLKEPPTYIQVWEFHDAPAEFKALSPHGGDEDWLALLPARYEGWTPSWLQDSGFGRCSTSTDVLPDGRIVCIGAHA